MLNISYNKLWKLLIDRSMKKKDLCAAAKSSTTSLSKLGRGENVTTDVLLKICRIMDCDFSDILKIVKE